MKATGTVVVADDAQASLELLRTILTRDGHTVHTARDGAHALTLTLSESPDVVVTDYGMPGMTGLELAEALRRELPRLAVVVATGYDDTRDGGLEGVTTLRKPFGQHALGSAIEDSLAGR